ncbi:MAG: insulinase family protein [Oscillospiraceae bacterium]
MTNERPENVWATTLPNGLRVRVLCKPDFQRSYAVFATCYGGADRRFRVGDTWTDTPAGVAHYLEHKLFDMPDGSDALLTLSENGADPNAFTSTNMTAYYFSCTDRFEENLRTLLRFVSTPYFTDASVARSRASSLRRSAWARTTRPRRVAQPHALPDGARRGATPWPARSRASRRSRPRRSTPATVRFTRRRTWCCAPCVRTRPSVWPPSRRRSCRRSAPPSRPPTTASRRT